MPGQDDAGRPKIPLKTFLADFKGNVSDQELIRKYGLSAQVFAKLIKTLLAKGIVTTQDLQKRRDAAVQRDLEKESEFLAGLYICPNCGHPNPTPFDVCPACGASVDSFSSSRDAMQSLTTPSGSIKIDDLQREVDEADAAHRHSSPPDRQESDEDEYETVGEAPSTDQQERSSVLKSVRSFFAKKLNKE